MSDRSFHVRLKPFAADSADAAEFVVEAAYFEVEDGVLKFFDYVDEHYLPRAVAAYAEWISVRRASPAKAIEPSRTGQARRATAPAHA